ncbi:lymphocyte antigen 6E [Microcaecilia unicolor]|uniref:Lymphocyte antigen 6E-like n=1 Tax=Microcaecilia unicolor TaxID=1415580 RepID=A0A6P7ZLK9_9AMPH|nr:lymphocyte antigen 6E-like [Microcaecilia unicolor]
MRTFLLPLLAAALCLHTAHALKCYTCVGAEKNSDCLKESTCTVLDKYCMTMVGTASGKTTIIKQCLPLCEPGKGESHGLSGTMSCCQSDLCNVSGAMSVRISFLTLVFSVGFVGTLLRGGL